MLDGGADGRPGRSAGSMKSGSAARLPPRRGPRGSEENRCIDCARCEQPRRERAAVVEGFETAIGAKKGVLNHIFAIRDRAGHWEQYRCSRGRSWMMVSRNARYRASNFPVSSICLILEASIARKAAGLFLSGLAALYLSQSGSANCRLYRSPMRLSRRRNIRTREPNPGA